MTKKLRASQRAQRDYKERTRCPGSGDRSSPCTTRTQPLPTSARLRGSRDALMMPNAPPAVMTFGPELLPLALRK